jgi:hypothetical protein
MFPPGTCRACGGLGTHSLHCRILRLRKGWYERVEWQSGLDPFERAWEDEHGGVT